MTTVRSNREDNSCVRTKRLRQSHVVSVIPTDRHTARRREFDRFFTDRILPNSQELDSVAKCREAAESILHFEPGFIHNVEFESLTLEELEGCRHAHLLFREPPARKDYSGLLDQMGSSALFTSHGEQFFFRRMNYMKFWASVFRSKLHRTRATKMSIARIQILFDEAQRDQSTIVNANIRLVLSLARKFSKSDQEMDELVSEGNVVLVNAAGKFDYSRGFRFSTYATHAVQRQIFRYWKTTQRRSRLSYVATPELVDQSVSTEPAVSQLATVASTIQSVLRVMPETLDEKEQYILCERFGLNPTKAAKTLRELGEELGISKERVRQLQLRAIGKLQNVVVE